MDDNNQQNHHNMQANNGGHSKWADYCRDGHGHHHYLLRLILGLVILGIVFMVGVKIGEFKSEFIGGNYGGYGRYMEQRGMMRTQDYGDGNMMYNQTTPDVVPFNSAAPATQIAPVQK